MEISSSHSIKGIIAHIRIYPLMEQLNASLIGLIRNLNGVETDLSKTAEVQGQILATLRDAKLSRAEWERYVTHHPTRFTRNLISKGDGLFNLLLLVWGPKQFSEIHNHGGSMCFFRVMEGRILEDRFEPSGTSPDPISSHDLGVGDTGFICDTVAIHKMTNPDPMHPAMSLHVYIPGYDQVSIYSHDLSNIVGLSLARCESSCSFDSIMGRPTNDHIVPASPAQKRSSNSESPAHPPSK